MPLAANVPTIAEQGVPGFETGTWQGVVVPAKTPEAVVQRLHEALITAIRSPEVRARLTGQGAEVVTDRKSTRLNSSHLVISYAVFCLKKKKKQREAPRCALVIPSTHPLDH